MTQAFSLPINFPTLPRADAPGYYEAALWAALRERGACIQGVAPG